MAVHLAVEADPDKPWPRVYCGSPGSVLFTRETSEVTCSACVKAHLTAAMDEKRPLGLFAVFYDGETRPVAGFVLEQDAARYAKEYAGGATWEIRRVGIADGEPNLSLSAEEAHCLAESECCPDCPHLKALHSVGCHCADCPCEYIIV